LIQGAAPPRDGALLTRGSVPGGTVLVQRKFPKETFGLDE
jgi:hypothetical protein